MSHTEYNTVVDRVIYSGAATNLRNKNEWMMLAYAALDQGDIKFSEFEDFYFEMVRKEEAKKPRETCQI